MSGGGTGIGAATARRLAAAGARVVVMGRRAGPVEEVAAEIGGLACVGDSAAPADAERAVTLAAGELGGLDVLIANAGGDGSAAALDVDDGLWEAVLRSNLTSSFVLARAALPALAERSGAIVVVSSVAGLFAIPDDVGYTAAKHALLGLTRSLARDYGPRGVRVNAICPGGVDTPMLRAGGVRGARSEEEARARGDRLSAYNWFMPIKRLSTPEEQAAVIAFLASDEASYVNGVALDVNGGLYMA